MSHKPLHRHRRIEVNHNGPNQPFPSRFSEERNIEDDDMVGVGLGEYPSENLFANWRVDNLTETSECCLVAKDSMRDRGTVQLAR